MSIRTSFSVCKAMSLPLIAVIIVMTATSTPVQSRPQDDPAAAEKVRAKVAKLGTGKRSRAEVTSKDDRKLKLPVRSINTPSVSGALYLSRK